ncbi:glucokinase [Azospirillum sp. SYSU D00513]|uniref:glucokinase n=1 Tax=Azospirillum sp. SYSU D00513 TaxID=2812561 RepID=UPI001A965E32|nr:glucokinase [Azospirillum sp. SYSU D00513]
MTDTVWPALVADIGGTNARFAIVTGPGAAPAQVRSLPAADYPNLPDAIAAYLDMTRDMTGERPRSACIAVAGPAVGDRILLSNRSWDFSVRAVAERFGFRPMLLINDCEALALSLPHLGTGQLLRLGEGEEMGEAGRPLALIAPGTGLGMSGVIPAGRGWVALSAEGGHADLAPVDDLEIEVLRIVRAERGRVSIESVLCGSGLERLHRAVATALLEPDEPLPASEITRRAIGGTDALCERTLTVYCGLLGGAAGNLALSLGARGGVFVGGGIPPRFAAFLAASPFRARFEAKGRMAAYLRPVPTWLVLAENPALNGAAAHLAQHANMVR